MIMVCVAPDCKEGYQHLAIKMNPESKTNSLSCAVSLMSSTILFDMFC